MAKGAVSFPSTPPPACHQSRNPRLGRLVDARRPRPTWSLALTALARRSIGVMVAQRGVGITALMAELVTGTFTDDGGISHAVDMERPVASLCGKFDPDISDPPLPWPQAPIPRCQRCEALHR